MKTIKPMNVTKLVLIGLTLSLFAACGGEGKSGGKKGKLNVRMESSVTTLNPYQKSTGYSRFVARQIFQELSVINPQTLLLEPLIIKELPEMRQVTDGSRKGQYTLDIEILPEAAWPNGSPLTAADYVFTLKILFHPGLNAQIFRSYFPDLNDVVVDPTNPKKFTVYFNKFFMLGVEAICQIPVMPAYHYDPGKWLSDVPLADFIDEAKATSLMASNPKLAAFADNYNNAKYDNDPASVVGSGPYQMVQFNADQNVILVKKANWWGDALSKTRPLLAAYPDTIEYRFIKDETALENYLRSDEIDVAGNITAAKFQAWKQDSQLTKSYDLLTKPALQYIRWMFNMSNPKLADKKVRHALSMLVDYNYITQTIQMGMARQIANPVFHIQKYYDTSIPMASYNIDQAKALLAEAGWKDTNGNGTVDKVINGKNTELTLEMLATTSAKSNEMLTASLTETCRLAGVGLRLKPVDLTALTPATQAGEYETALMAVALLPGFYDFYQQFHSASLAPAGDNRSRMANPEADKVFEAQRNASNETDRKKYYYEAQRIYHDEMPEVPLYVSEMRFIVSKKYDYVISSNRPGYYEHLFKLK